MLTHRNWVQRLKQTHPWQNIYCCALIQHTMCSGGQMAIYASRCYEQMKALLTYLLLFSWPHHCNHCMEGLHEWLPPIDSIFSLASLYNVLKMCYIKCWNIWETHCRLFIPFVWRGAKKLGTSNALLVYSITLLIKSSHHARYYILPSCLVLYILLPCSVLYILNNVCKCMLRSRGVVLPFVGMLSIMHG